ncbi:MAG TPA: hypothetical protein VF577_03410 [Allosphingosinicella sp.]|jgi:hypothetical protein
MRSYRFGLAVPLLMAGAAAGAQQPATAAPESDIRVVGAREEPTAAVVTTGSRIPARSGSGPFPGIASATGVAGLTPGSGMDPSSQFTRTIVEAHCRSDDARLSEAAACRLVPIQRMLASGDHEGARAALDRFAFAEGTSDDERYIAARLSYTIAVATGEASDREDALRAMLATAAMPTAERPAALRTLISLALARGDEAGAAALIEQLLLVVPEDTRSLINLASLRSRAGRQAEAATLVEQAIALTRGRGEPIPREWLAFASSAATPE